MAGRASDVKSWDGILDSLAFICLAAASQLVVMQ